MRAGRLFSQLAPLLLFLVLAGLALHTGWVLTESRDALVAARRSSRLSAAYEDARWSVITAEASVYKFAYEQDPEEEASFNNALQDAVASLSVISRLGEERDKAFVDRLYQDHAAQIATAADFFAAIKNGTRADESAAPGLVQQIGAALNEQAARSEQESRQQLASFQAFQDRNVMVSITAFGFGLPMILVLFYFMRRQAKAESRAQSELRRLREAAHTDSLTGLGNHRAFQEEFQECIDTALADHSSLTIALIDIDDFKAVNDRAGHARGDLVLVDFAGILRQVPVQGSNLFRVGGDEFAVLMPGMTPADANDCMEALRKQANQGLQGVTVSIGTAVLASSDGDKETLKDKADLALYEAKRKGKNYISAFSATHGRTLGSQAKLTAVRSLIETGNVKVVFQPVWRVDDRSVLAFEALSRFPDYPELSGPEEAFDLAERLGKAFELDMECIQAVLAEASALPPDAMLFMNLSPRSFEHSLFSPEQLAATAEATGRPTYSICLEVTERATAPIEVIKEMCARLRALGFKIALDDVGSGNSGLEILNQVPVDFVKIDQAVISGAMRTDRSRAVMQAIIAFAVEAGASVIAEGIETPEMLQLIRRTNGIGTTLRIEGIQGYLLGRPQEARQIVRSLQKAG